MVVDHLIPKWQLVKAGFSDVQINASWNLQTLCWDCNQLKGSMIPPKDEVMAIYEIDTEYARRLHAEYEALLDDTIWHPLVSEFEDMWEFVRDFYPAHDDIRHELPPNNWWCPDVQRCIEAGANGANLYDLICEAHANKKRRDAYDECRQLMLENWPGIDVNDPPPLPGM